MKLNFALLAVAAVLLPAEAARDAETANYGVCFGREFGHPPGGDESDDSYYKKHGKFPDRMPNEKPKNQPDEMPKEKPDNQLDEKVGHQRRADPDNPFDFPESDGEEDEDIDRDPVSVLDFESDGEESDDDTGDDSRDD
ncbi:hypothetical protein LY78DRAFT_721948 [Colletotrichum sublineola]|nr:hypothetical protein LY78DRAFT_721948 [Colletotrichum sublineola]